MSWLARRMALASVALFTLVLAVAGGPALGGGGTTHQNAGTAPAQDGIARQPDRAMAAVAPDPGTTGARLALFMDKTYMGDFRSLTGCVTVADIFVEGTDHSLGEAVQQPCVIQFTGLKPTFEAWIGHQLKSDGLGEPTAMQIELVNPATGKPTWAVRIQRPVLLKFQISGVDVSASGPAVFSATITGSTIAAMAPFAVPRAASIAPLPANQFRFTLEGQIQPGVTHVGSLGVARVGGAADAPWRVSDMDVTTSVPRSNLFTDWYGATVLAKGGPQTSEKRVTIDLFKPNSTTLAFRASLGGVGVYAEDVSGLVHSQYGWTMYVDSLNVAFR